MKAEAKLWIKITGWVSYALCNLVVVYFMDSSLGLLAAAYVLGFVSLSLAVRDSAKAWLAYATLQYSAWVVCMFALDSDGPIGSRLAFPSLLVSWPILAGVGILHLVRIGELFDGIGALGWLGLGLLSVASQAAALYLALRLWDLSRRRLMGRSTGVRFGRMTVKPSMPGGRR
jgi:hypothetical protein